MKDDLHLAELLLFSPHRIGWPTWFPKSTDLSRQNCPGDAIGKSNVCSWCCHPLAVSRPRQRMLVAFFASHRQQREWEKSRGRRTPRTRTGRGRKILTGAAPADADQMWREARDPRAPASSCFRLHRRCTWSQYVFFFWGGHGASTCAVCVHPGPICHLVRPR